MDIPGITSAPHRSRGVPCIGDVVAGLTTQNKNRVYQNIIGRRPDWFSDLQELDFSHRNAAMDSRVRSLPAAVILDLGLHIHPLPPHAKLTSKFGAKLAEHLKSQLIRKGVLDSPLYELDQRISLAERQMHKCMSDLQELGNHLEWLRSALRQRCVSLRERR